MSERAINTQAVTGSCGGNNKILTCLLELHLQYMHQITGHRTCLHGTVKKNEPSKQVSASLWFVNHTYMHTQANSAGPVEKIHIKEVVTMARMVPVGMDLWASRRSPDLLEPAMIPEGNTDRYPKSQSPVCCLNHQDNLQARE